METFFVFDSLAAWLASISTYDSSGLPFHTPCIMIPVLRDVIFLTFPPRRISVNFGKHFSYVNFNFTESVLTKIQVAPAACIRVNVFLMVYIVMINPN